MAVTVKKGSSGDPVKKLQTALNKNGYNLTVDGIFGSKTESALKSYQSKHSLTVDGIAGAKTWASLNSSGGAAKQTKQAAAPAAEPAEPVTTPQGNSYDPAVTTAAKADLDAREAAAPEPYVSAQQPRIDALLGALSERKPFSYDLSSDPLYRQYRQEYLADAARAMEDARGNAAAASGGYGSSYAETAGQLAYQDRLRGLYDLIPSLYESARGAYDTVYDDALRELEALQSEDEAAYKRYSDDYDRYLDWLRYQYNKVADEQEQENFKVKNAKK